MSDLACDVCGSPYARHAHIDRGTSIQFAKAALCPDHFRDAVKAWERWIARQAEVERVVAALKGELP